MMSALTERVLCYIALTVVVFTSSTFSSTSTASPDTTAVTSSTFSSTSTASPDTTSVTSSTFLSTSTASPATPAVPRKCFQCSASGPDEPCVKDTASMANSSTRDMYIKDCTATNNNWTVCMIQTIEVGGKFIFYHRDCTDGRYFPPALYSPRFVNLPSNNYTTCDLVVDKVVCYQLCNRDLCNGPKPYPEPNNTDQCSAYWADPYGVTLSPGTTCGARGDFNSQDPFTRFLSLLVSLFVTGWISIPVMSLLYHIQK